MPSCKRGCACRYRPWFFCKTTSGFLHAIADYAPYGDIFSFMPFRSPCFFLVAVLSAVVSSVWAQEGYVTQDLTSEWTIFDDGAYRPYERERDADEDIVYFTLDAASHRNAHVRISGRHVKAVFVNGKLVASGNVRNVMYDVDSLADRFPGRVLHFGVYASHIYPENLNVSLVLPGVKPAAGPEEIVRPRTYFRDFVVSGIILLFILLIVVTQLTKVPIAFFFTRRVFAAQEGEEVQLYTRIASTTNILFYVFTSLVIAFYLMILYRASGDRYVLGLANQAETYFGTVLKWGRLGSILLVAFCLKIGLVMLMSRTFGLGEYLGFQVVNWMRLMLVSFGILTVAEVVYFLSGGMSGAVYAAFMWGFIVVLIAWVILFFTKVARRPGYSLFHIISYLCATEVLPLLISVKLLFH
nr:MAG: hypothetical protein DIU61_19900 [Bacteroidota bacterium]